MPLYDYHCQNCKVVFEKAYKLVEYKKHPVPICPKCKEYKTVRVMLPGHGGIQCDSAVDITWMPSALKTLQREGERPIETRGEYKDYIKNNQLVEKG